MTARRCPYCELAFATASERSDHVATDHPARGEQAPVDEPPPEPQPRL
jgi:hypothetical protein